MKGPRCLRISRALSERRVDDYVGVTGPRDAPTASPFGAPHAPMTVGPRNPMPIVERDTRSVAEVIADMVRRT